MIKIFTLNEIFEELVKENNGSNISDFKSFVINNRNKKEKISRDFIDLIVPITNLRFCNEILSLDIKEKEKDYVYTGVFISNNKRKIKKLLQEKYDNKKNNNNSKKSDAEIVKCRKKRRIHSMKDLEDLSNRMLIALNTHHTGVMGLEYKTNELNSIKIIKNKIRFSFTNLNNIRLVMIYDMISKNVNFEGFYFDVPLPNYRCKNAEEKLSKIIEQEVLKIEKVCL